MKIQWPSLASLVAVLRFVCVFIAPKDHSFHDVVLK